MSIVKTFKPGPDDLDHFQRVAKRIQKEITKTEGIQAHLNRIRGKISRSLDLVKDKGANLGQGHIDEIKADLGHANLTIGTVVSSNEKTKSSIYSLISGLTDIKDTSRTMQKIMLV